MQFNAHSLMHRLPDVTREHFVLVGDESFGHAEQAKPVVEDESGDLLGSLLGATGKRLRIARETVP